MRRCIGGSLSFVLHPTNRRCELAYEPGAIHVGCRRHRRIGFKGPYGQG